MLSMSIASTLLASYAELSASSPLSARQILLNL